MTVKLLILSDIHNQRITLEQILLQVKKRQAIPKYCVVAGDITNFGTAEDMQQILDILTNHFLETFFVLGNCDPFVNLSDLDSSATYIESRAEKMGHFSIVGFGSHKPKLKNRLLRKLRKSNEKVCLLTHVPPHNTNADMVSLNRHTGSRELKGFIDRNQHIFLVISGHIHDSPTISQHNNTTIINPGSVTVGNYAIIEIQEDFHINRNLYNLHECETK